MNKIIKLFVLCSLWGFGFASFADERSSLYSLKTKWQNQNAKEVQLKKFEGSFVILSMVYTSCPHTCPLTISKIEAIKKRFFEAGVKDVKYVLASFDVENDTPEHLKKYMKKRKMNEKEWVFLSPKNEAAVRELSVVLGISYKKIGNGDFSHSNIVTLLDKKGAPIANIKSLSEDIDIFLKTIKGSNL